MWNDGGHEDGDHNFDHDTNLETSAIEDNDDYFGYDYVLSWWGEWHLMVTVAMVVSWDKMKNLDWIRHGLQIVLILSLLFLSHSTIQNLYYTLFRNVPFPLVGSFLRHP